MKYQLFPKYKQTTLSWTMQQKLKNSQKVQKMHFLAVFELLLDSLTAIYVELHQCPSHHSILLTQGPIWEIFVKKFWELAILKNVVFLSRAFWIFFFWITSQSLLVSKDGSKLWSRHKWQHFLTQTKHFEGECTLHCDYHRNVNIPHKSIKQ